MGNLSVGFTAGADPGKHGKGNVECFENLLVPRQSLQIHELSAAGVGCIGHVNAAVRTTSQLPDQESIDGAEENLTIPSLGAQAGQVIEEPANLQCAEVCREG